MLDDGAEYSFVRRAPGCEGWKNRGREGVVQWRIVVTMLAKDYNAIIKAKNLDLHYESVTFGTFGSFGTGTWGIITKACDPSTHPKGLGEFNPWNAPGPKRDFILSLGFALQRANSRMLRNADRRRRNARGCGLYSSGTRPSSSDDDY